MNSANPACVIDTTMSQGLEKVEAENKFAICSYFGAIPINIFTKFTS